MEQDKQNETILFLQNQLEKWFSDNEEQHAILFAAVDSSHKEPGQYSAMASLCGDEGAVLACFEHLLTECPKLADIMSVAIQKTQGPQHNSRYLS